MEERLYLFEVLIDNIFFEESVTEIPRKKQIVVTVKLGNIVSLEIRSETLPVGGEAARSKRLIDFKSGKSHLIPLLQQELLESLSHHLEVSVSVRGDIPTYIGSSSSPWDDSFREMVKVSDEEFVEPAFISDDFCLLENGVIKGNVQMFLRLSCFGKSIQTQFEVVPDSGNRQFLFKAPNMATTFICSKYGAGTSTDFIPIGPLYHAGYGRNAGVGGRPSNPRPTTSWTAVMEGRASSMMEKRNSLQSVCLFPEYLNIKPPVRDSTITFDIASLRARPEEDKFLDFLTGKKFGELTDSIYSFSIADDEGNERVIYYFDDGKKEESQKESKACQCPVTPTYCKHVYAAIQKYEKSHPNLMIFGKRVRYDKILKRTENSYSEKSDSLLRLRGGSDEVEPYQLKKNRGCHNPCCKVAFKLRSVGLSQLAENNHGKEKNEDYFCADFYCPESTRRNIALQIDFSEDNIPSSFACSSIYCPAAKMFKKLGLGPLAKERCQGTLYGPVKPPVQYGLSQTYGTFDTYGPYGIFSKTNTPFMQGEGKTAGARSVLRLRGGGSMEVMNVSSSRLRGGSPSKSPIAECQKIMEQFDKILEDYKKALETGNNKERIIDQYMEPSTTSNCGHPRCTYISEPALKAIHWDCPDPLPVGICSNPNCPYLPEDLKRIEKILATKGRNRSEHTNGDRTQSPYHESTQECRITRHSTSQVCPFYNPQKIVNMMQFLNSSLPNLKKPVSCCSNPSCPLKGIVSSCSNPNCPFAHGDITEPCSNPDCPFAQRQNTEPCSNPNCPFKHTYSSAACPDNQLLKIESFKPCSNPDCPYKKSNVSQSCSNPECPYKNSNLSTTPKTGLSEESCHNPECPFNKRIKSEEACQNPDCPFNQKSADNTLKINEDLPPVWTDIFNQSSECKCDNPNCPAHKETCSNPECPFNLKQEGFCGNPKCPYKSLPSSKKKGTCSSPFRSICGDKTCPFHEESVEERKDEEKGKQAQVGGGDGMVNKNQDKDTIQTHGLNVIEGAVEHTEGDRSSRYDMAPCTLTTCKYMGGKLKCVDCATLTEGRRRAPCPKICPGDVKCPLALGDTPKFDSKKASVKKLEVEKRALKKARMQFAYHFGDDYPGMHMGHKDCVISPFNVPSKMGWLWNIHTPCLKLRPRKGWRPGAIGKTILAAIQAHRRSQNLPPLEEGKIRRRKKFGGGDESESELIHPKPTLQIKRKEGVYYITMNPLKDPRSLVQNENPYMEVTPLQFRIMKAKENNEYKSCVCNDQGIVYEPESSSSDSELDIEFTPPAGIIRPERFVKIKDVIHMDTQYNLQDITPQTNDKPKAKDKEDKEKDNGNDKKKDKDNKKNEKNKDKEKTADKTKEKGKSTAKAKKKK